MSMTRTHWLLLLGGIALLLLLLGGAWFFLIGTREPVADRAARLRSGPAITIEAVYPGASASVVADTVAAPIEQPVQGVEGMTSLVSRCSSDGSCILTATFKPGTDLDIAQVLVQNRIALALPALPDAVQKTGVTVPKKAPGVLLLLAVSNHDDDRATDYLGNYAGAVLADELPRVPGVGDVMEVAVQERSLRVQLDLEKAALCGVTANDVLKALELRKVAFHPGPQNGGIMEIRIDVKGMVPKGQLPRLEPVEQIVVKEGLPKPQSVDYMLRDVARVFQETNGPKGYANLNGHGAVILAVSPLPQARPQEVSAAVGDLLTRLRPTPPPDGAGIQVAFDFTPNWETPGGATAPEYLLLDLMFPAGVSLQRRFSEGERCAKLLREVQGVQDVLLLSDNPFDGVRGRVCILVRLAPAGNGRPAREEVVQAIRTRIGEIAGMALRVRDLSGTSRFPSCGYPIDLAVSGPEQDRVAKMAEKLAERLGRTAELTDVSANPESRPQPQLSIDIDRAKAEALGVSMEDVFGNLQVGIGALNVNDFNRFGRTWQVTVEADRKKVEDLRDLKVRTNKGDAIALSAFSQLRMVMEPAAIARFDGRPMVEITANLASGVSPTEARRLCESLAEEVRKELDLPQEYRLTWMQE
jgi:multidrug efflux pump subunit AcrB